MAKGTHGGGRYGGGGGVSPGDIVSERDMVSMVAEGSKRQEAGDVMSVSDDMVREYGDDVQLFTFNVAELKPKAQSAIAYYDGKNIAINENYFDTQKINTAYEECVKTGFHPKKGNKTAMQAVAAHEYGHALTDFAARKMGGERTPTIDEAATRIVKEARTMTNHRGVVQMARGISVYATHSNAEAVAEAVADVYCNGNRAARESRAIVNVLNGYLKR